MTVTDTQITQKHMLLTLQGKRGGMTIRLGVDMTIAALEANLVQLTELLD